LNFIESLFDNFNKVVSGTIEEFNLTVESGELKNDFRKSGPGDDG